MLLEVTVDGDEMDAETVTISARVSDGVLLLTFTEKKITRVLIDHTGTEASRDVSTWDETAEDLWFAD